MTLQKIKLGMERAIQENLLECHVTGQRDETDEREDDNSEETAWSPLQK